jgi:hypothetical protein
MIAAFCYVTVNDRQSYPINTLLLEHDPVLMCREVMVRREALRGQAGTSLRGLEGESSVDLNLRLVNSIERIE